MNDLEEFGEAGEVGEEPRANLIAWGSVVVGGKAHGNETTDQTQRCGSVSTLSFTPNGPRTTR